ncbi:MAG TPA: hypothetical protein VHZ24_17825 [Pirellulales bacterium]|jgi:hypothetical protein|nr:hypothetical protein [Pirellulales bacterium]
MLRLRFQGQGVAITAGPEEQYRIERDRLLNPRGDVLARYGQGCWDVGGEPCTRIDIRDPFVVQFEGARGIVAARGPFEIGALDDRRLIEGHTDNLVAQLHDKHRLWHDDDGRMWPVLTLKPLG